MGGIVQEIKDSIEQAGLVGSLTREHVLACLLTALGCGAVIYAVYRFFYKGAVYSESFNMLNVITCLITAMIFMTIATNLVLSLGMVGALSIVRFRAAVKDPLDIGFLFLAVAAGLASGAGLFPLAFAGTLFILLVYLLLSFLGGGKRGFILVIKYADSSKAQITEKVRTLKGKLKSVVAYGSVTELTVAVKVRGADTSIPDDIKKIEGVESTVLLEYVRD
jgi:uncharacterized membrane-anchored protein